MQHHTFRLLSAVTLLVGTLAVLIACGGGGGDTAPAPSASTPAAVTPTPTPTPTAQPDHELRPNLSWSFLKP